MNKEKGKNICLAFLNVGLFYALPILFSGLISIYFIDISNILRDILLFSIEFLVCVVMCLVNYKLLKNDLKKFKSNYKNCLNEGFKYYVLGLMLMIISNLIIVNINGGNIANNEELNRSIVSIYPLYAITSIAFLGPITEELTFRGGFKKAFSNIIFYTIFTGILFGGAHIVGNVNTFTDILFIVPYSLLGIICVIKQIIFLHLLVFICFIILYL